MLNIRSYPRKGWQTRLWVPTVLVSLGIALGYGIPVGIRIAAVVEAQGAAENAAKANRFWLMVAGDVPLDGSDIGRVAAATRELAASPNPIGVMMNERVAPGELPDIGDTLGFHAFERTDPNNRDKTVSDGGRFTDAFILRTLQATGAVEDSSVDALIKPIPQVPAYGWLRWEWGVAALASVLGLATAVSVWLRKDARRWPGRAHAQALAELTTEQREVYDIVEALEEQPCSEERDQLLWDAKALFRDMRQGLGGGDAGDRLTELRCALADAAQSWTIRRGIYETLPGIRSDQSVPVLPEMNDVPDSAQGERAGAGTHPTENEV